MIDEKKPDYANTPASAARPAFAYTPRASALPYVSILTPFYNTRPAIFLETVRAVSRMSFANWEWLIVDDESTDAESLAALESLRASEPRVRVLRQKNAGPAVARNRAAKEARGTYLLQVDSDDLMEPTFVEKAVWFLETQPQFAAANSFNVTFGAKNFLWPNGFQQYEWSLRDNRMTMEAVIRREDFWKAGGYDESISYEHADWDFWLNLAEVGLWGYTLTEYLTWYRTQQRSLMTEIEGDGARAKRFRAWLQAKHARLAVRFPHPVWMPGRDIPHAEIHEESTVVNPLVKPEGSKHILFVLPWLEMGGADKFNLDVIRLLAARGYRFTVVTTVNSEHRWLREFTRLTPDVFCLEKFLSYADYPRFVNYLIETRQIDAVLMSNSQLAYFLTPYLRTRHPQLAMLDYNHMEIEDWQDGGYPRHAVRLGGLLDLNVVNTEHLRRWMTRRGADPERVEVVHCNVETAEWAPESHDRAATRERLRIPPETPVILFTGRVVDQKRPLLFVEILRQLAKEEPDFMALVVGTGDRLDAMKRKAEEYRLADRVRFLGALPNEQVRELMAASDILLLPSDHEGLALVLFECMAMEMVPVGADVGGQAELVTPECGYLIPRSKEAQVEITNYVVALRELLHDPERRCAMGRAGRERVVAQFDMQQMADGMERAVARAQALAAARPESAGDPVAARLSAHMAVEYTRMEEVTNLLWHQRNQLPRVQLVRALRERILPIGSRRYEAYKRLRHVERALRHRILALPRRLKRLAASKPTAGDPAVPPVPEVMLAPVPAHTLEVLQERPAVMRTPQPPAPEADEAPLPVRD